MIRIHSVLCALLVCVACEGAPPVPAGYVVTVAPVDPVAGSTVTVEAQLVDADGEAVGIASQAVTWSSGGTGGSFASPTTTTGANGVATVAFTTSTVAGVTHTIAVSDADGLTGTSPLLTTVAGPAARLAVTTPPSASASRAVFGTQPVVQVQDRNRNAVARAGIVVTASAPGGPTLSGPPTTVTGPTGAAAFSGLSLAGTVGQRRINFTSPGLDSAFVLVTLTAGPATAVRAQGGNGQAADPGTTVPNPPAVRVVDADGNGVAGIAVQFAVTGGGGVATGTSKTTDAQGIATVGSWALGPTPGVNTLVASMAGATPAVTFVAYGRPPIAACGVETTLVLDLTQDGNLVASPCTLADPVGMGTNRTPFTGPVAGGAYAYDRYVVTVPAGVRINVMALANNFFFTILAFGEDGTFVAMATEETDYPLELAGSPTERRYQILVTPLRAGATGPYRILMSRVE